MFIPDWLWQSWVGAATVAAAKLAWNHRHKMLSHCAETLELFPAILESATLPQYRPHTPASPEQDTNPAPDSQAEHSDSADTQEAYRPSKPRAWDYPPADVHETAAEHLDRVIRDAERALTYNVHQELVAFDAQKALATRSVSEHLADLDADMKLAMLSPAEHMRRIEEDMRMATSGHALDALR